MTEQTKRVARELHDAGRVALAIEALTGSGDALVRCREALMILRGDLDWCIKAARIEEESGVTPRAGKPDADADAGRGRAKP